MARPIRDGLAYFPLDTDFFSDNKIRILKARFGTGGIAVYLYLLCEIYKNGYYLAWNEDLKYILASELGLADGLIEQVLTFLLERSLLDSKLFKSDTILTSPGIQRRYQKAISDRARKRAPEAGKGFWLLEEEEALPPGETRPENGSSRKNGSYSGKNLDNSGKNAVKKSKVKESKENKIKENKSKQNKSKETDAPEAPALRDAPPPAFELAMLDGSFYPIPEEDVGRYKGLYPAADIRAELGKMADWLRAHPENRKTPFGIRKFITNWLSRAQDSARPVRAGSRGAGAAGRQKNRFHNFDERENNGYEEKIWEQIRRRGKEEGERRKGEERKDHGEGHGGTGREPGGSPGSGKPGDTGSPVRGGDSGAGSAGAGAAGSGGWGGG